MSARALMLQGTASHVGKSLLTAGLARAFTGRGLRVRPFKPQNMSNNAAVAADGGEIGRAQALQARACRVPASHHMNPVLLKPSSETGAQIVLRGRVFGQAEARAYHRLKPRLLPAVLESFATLAADADLVLVEGAGSPAEVNLRDGDIANMGFACAARVPVLLVGDVERGGVLAALIGTAALLEPAERALVAGYLVNKFRGDPRLFDEALTIITRRSGLPALGLVPWFAGAARLPAEDVLGLPAPPACPVEGDTIHIVVPRLPRLANADDLDPLLTDPRVRLTIMEPGTVLPGDAGLVLLLGSKATIPDLAALRAAGWDTDIVAHVRRGGRVLGLCGGYQMLGRRIADPHGSEGPAGGVPGLGLLDVETELAADKTVVEVAATELLGGTEVRGYEIHLGRTAGSDSVRPLLRIAGRPDGARSPDGRVMGCYLHGLLASDAFRDRLLGRAWPAELERSDQEALVERTLDALADHLERHLDLDRLLACARAPLVQAEAQA